MPGLLDYIKGYQHGGSVDFDPYADTSQADMLTKLGIDITDPEAYGLLPTYDPTGADITRGKYDLTTAGLSDTLATARRGGTRSLFDLTKQVQQQQAGTGFAGSGAGAQAMTNVRGDIISGFGDISADIGRREDQAYLDLQRDIFDERRGYESDLLAAIGDLDPESWSYDAGTSTSDDPYVHLPVDCHGKCSHLSDEVYSICIQQCEDEAESGDDPGCSGGLVWNGSECVDPNQYGEGNCPSGYYWDDALSKCQYGSGSGLDIDKP